MDGTNEDALSVLTDLIGDTLDSYAEDHDQARVDDEAVAELTDAITREYALVPRDALSAFELDVEDRDLLYTHGDGSRCRTPVTCPTAWESLTAVLPVADDA